LDIKKERSRKNGALRLSGIKNEIREICGMQDFREPDGDSRIPADGSGGVSGIRDGQSHLPEDPGNSLF